MFTPSSPSTSAVLGGATLHLRYALLTAQDEITRNHIREAQKALAPILEAAYADPFADEAPAVSEPAPSPAQVSYDRYLQEQVDELASEWDALSDEEQWAIESKYAD